MPEVKVLVINTVGMYRNGITQVIYDYYSRFDMEKFEVHIVSGVIEPEEVRRFFLEAKAIVHTISPRKKKPIAYIIDLVKLCRKEQFDIIHVHGNSATMAVELAIGKLCGVVNRISHVHNSKCDAKKADKLLRPVFYKMYTEAFACGELAGKWMYKNKPFTVIKNGRSLEKFCYKPEQRKQVRNILELSESDIAVGHIGNFNEQKNHYFLIKVFQELYRRNNKFKLFLVGYGHCEDSIKKMVRQIGLQDAVVFMGIINNVDEILQAMDIMMLPSLYEGLPLVVVEWQLAALPCIIADSITKECAFSELVSFKSLSDDLSDWAEEVERLIQRDREEDAHNVIKAAKDNGYDIDVGVKNLMTRFEAFKEI